jgi:ketosteroid isomerase-like protein
MSQQNVETVRASIEHFNREGFLPEDLYTPDVEVLNIRESPLPGPYRGHAGLRRWRDDLFEVVEEGRFEIEELVDAHEASAVVARVRIRGRARHTGIAVDLPLTIVSWVREGRTHRSEGFSHHREALEAVGLRGPHP